MVDSGGITKNTTIVLSNDVMISVLSYGIHFLTFA